MLIGLAILCFALVAFVLYGSLALWCEIPIYTMHKCMLGADWKVKVKTTPKGRKEYYPMARVLFAWYYFERIDRESASLSIFPDCYYDTLEDAKAAIDVVKARLKTAYGTKDNDIKIE